MAVELENELRQAMRQQAYGHSAPPTLLAEVRRRHRRHTARVQLTAAAAAVAVAAGAFPAYRAIADWGGSSGRAPVLAGPAASHRMIDNFEVTYVPEGMEYAGARAGASDRHTFRGGTWRSCLDCDQSTAMTIDIVRGPIVYAPSELRTWAGLREAQGVMVRDRPGWRGRTPAGSTVIWRYGPHAVVRVATGPKLAGTGELVRIAKGIRLQAPPRFVDGVEVTYLPDGLPYQPFATSEHQRTWASIQRGWSEQKVPGDRWVIVYVIRGGGARDLATLRRARDYLTKARHTTVGGTRALASNAAGGGTDLLWVAGDNLALQVSAGPGISDDELMKVAEGLRL